MKGQGGKYPVMPIFMPIYPTHSLNIIKGLITYHVAASGIIDPAQANIIGYLMTSLQMR